jgi:hypothetical protein
MTAINYQRGLSDWTAGTASVNNGLRTVTFSGAGLVSTDAATGAPLQAVQVGDWFVLPAVGAAMIESVDSDSQVTLTAPWPFANQSAVAYKIRRYAPPATGAVAKAVQDLLNQGTDASPDLSRTIDDSVARLKLRESGGALQLAVGASGAADGALLAALSLDPATGIASFPQGLLYSDKGLYNRLINGGFEFWSSVGASPTIAASATSYTADQWGVANHTAVSVVASQVALPSGFEGKNALNIAATAVPAGGYIDVIQPIESQNLYDLDGKKCTLSFYLNASTSGGSLSGAVYVYANSGGSDNNSYNVTLINGAGFTLPVGSGRISMAFSAAQMIGLAAGGKIVIRLTQTTATGNVSATFGAMQFGLGASAQIFEMQPRGIEHLLVKRFFETSYPGALIPGTVTASGFGRSVDATNSFGAIQCPFKFIKRSSPTVTIYSPGTGASGKIYNTNAAVDVNGFANLVNFGSFTAVVNNVPVLQSETIAVHWVADSRLGL